MAYPPRRGENRIYSGIWIVYLNNQTNCGKICCTCNLFVILPHQNKLYERDNCL